MRQDGLLVEAEPADSPVVVEANYLYPDNIVYVRVGRHPGNVVSFVRTESIHFDIDDRGRPIAIEILGSSVSEWRRRPSLTPPRGGSDSFDLSPASRKQVRRKPSKRMMRHRSFVSSLRTGHQSDTSPSRRNCSLGSTRTASFQICGSRNSPPHRARLPVGDDYRTRPPAYVS